MPRWSLIPVWWSSLLEPGLNWAKGLNCWPKVRPVIQSFSPVCLMIGLVLAVRLIPTMTVRLVFHPNLSVAIGQVSMLAQLPTSVLTTFNFPMPVESV